MELHSITSYPEKELLQLMAAGDQAAFRLIFDRYWPSMYANALKFTKSADMAEDLTQEVFIKVWAHREKLAAVERFEAYLYIIARNTIYNQLRKQFHQPGYMEKLAACLDDGISPQEKLELKELEHTR